MQTGKILVRYVFVPVPGLPMKTRGRVISGSLNIYNYWCEERVPQYMFSCKKGPIFSEFQ